MTPLAHPSSCHDHYKQASYSRTFIRKILSNKIGHNSSAVGLEKISIWYPSFVASAVSYPLESSTAPLVRWSFTHTGRRPHRMKHSSFLELMTVRKAKAEPKKTPNQTRMQLCKETLFLLRGIELLCNCLFRWKLHSCKVTEPLHKLSLFNAILLYTLCVDASNYNWPKHVAVKC